MMAVLEGHPTWSSDFCGLESIPVLHLLEDELNVTPMRFIARLTVSIVKDELCTKDLRE